MSELGRGRVAANGITLESLEAREAPLALCMHGSRTFRSPAATCYRARGAGFHAVAPFVRRLAPTELPPLRHHVHTT